MNHLVRDWYRMLPKEMLRLEKLGKGADSVLEICRAMWEREARLRRKLVKLHWSPPLTVNQELQELHPGLRKTASTGRVG